MLEMIVSTLDSDEQKDPSWTSFERDVMIPCFGILLILGLCLLPYSMKRFYQAITEENKNEQSENIEEQENMVL